MGGKAERERLRLWVENSGPALPADIVERLGEPFLTTKPLGTGLGLAITRSIARAHEGDLVLEDNRQGQVRFALDLPAGHLGEIL